MAHGLETELENARSVKSRHGSIPTNVSTLMKTATFAAFADEITKLSQIDEPTVIDAATKLQKPRPWKNIGQTAAMVGTAAPAIEAAGRFTKGVVDTHGGLGARVAGGVAGVGKMTAGEAVAKSLTGGLGGGAIAAAREGIEVHNARKTVRQYIAQSKLSFAMSDLLRKITPEQQRQIDQENAQVKSMAKGALGTAGVVAPAWTAEHAAERLLGAQRFVHGTGPRAAEKIKKEGLRPEYGGTGGAKHEGVAAYREASKGHVHVAVPSEPLYGGDGIARGYANMGAAAEKGLKPDPVLSFLRGAVSPGEGKVVAGAMPYEQFISQFSPDPDYEMAVPGAAFRSTSPVDAKHLGNNNMFSRAKKIVQNRAPDLLGYAKRNTKRVASGAGLAAATVAAPVAGYHLLKSMKRDVAAYKDIGKEKAAGLLGGVGGAPSGPSGPKISTPSAPTLGVLRGSSNKGQRVGNTPIAAKSGTTNSASGDAMNPRRNLGDAMRAYKA